MSRITKTFHLGDLLSVTTPYLLSPTRMDGVESLLTHVTGETRESDLHMVEMSLRVRNVLLEQHPWLAHVSPPGGDDQNELMTWFAYEVVQRGPYHDVSGAEVVDAVLVESSLIDEPAPPAEIEVQDATVVESVELVDSSETT